MKHKSGLYENEFHIGYILSILRILKVIKSVDHRKVINAAWNKALKGISI